MTFFFFLSNRRRQVALYLDHSKANFSHTYISVNIIDRYSHYYVTLSKIYAPFSKATEPMGHFSSQCSMVPHSKHTLGNDLSTCNGGSKMSKTT